MNKLTEGRGNIIKKIENLKDLGAKTKKSLTTKILLTELIIMKITRYENAIFGLRPIIEVIIAGQEIDTLFIQKGLKGELFSNCGSWSKNIE